MPDILVCFQLIRYLPPEYDNLVQILYRIKYEEFTVDNITKQLISGSGRIELKSRDENRVQSVTDAYTAGVRKPEENRQRGKNTETRSYGSGNVMDPGVRRIKVNSNIDVSRKNIQMIKLSVQRNPVQTGRLKVKGSNLQV
ncbi:hypothetical protein AVEN_99031-1 [Araneus ventricosus]|uniref:Uncharacterized protein n=1 Tax=Araneus ventricosus TaxID=182803 RepID=A0A4Y2SH40_ARAVE|nr:hypothetical protein AVEN_99031-1 [Araneus ventricosus]